MVEHSVLSTRDRLKRIRALERGDSPNDWWSSSAEMPEPAPPEKPKRIPRIAITQPTNATKSRTLKVAQERERKPCDQCGATFQQKRWTQKFCSPECTSRNKYERNREQALARSKAAYQRRKSESPTPKMTTTRCRWCKVEFERTQHSQRFCSLKCRQQGQSWEKHSKTLAAREITYRCLECQQECVYVTGREKYCGAKCRNRVKERNRRERMKALGGPR